MLHAQRLPGSAAALRGDACQPGLGALPLGRSAPASSAGRCGMPAPVALFGNPSPEGWGRSTPAAWLRGFLPAASAAASAIAEPLASAAALLTSSRDEPAADVEFPEGPVLSCGGGGLFFFWQVGVIKYLWERYDLSQCTMIGASAGGLIGTLACCDVDLDYAVERAYQISEEVGLFDRPLGLAGIWGGLVRRWLDELLPADAAQRCSGRLRLIVTEVPSLRQVYVQEFATRDELLDACMASAHVPLFLDGRPFASVRGRLYLDGSLEDFIKWDNSPLLKCGGRAFVLDYSTDDELMRGDRLDFLKLRQFDEVLQMIKCGFAYAQRLEAQGGFDAALGSARRAAARA